MLLSIYCGKIRIASRVMLCDNTLTRGLGLMGRANLDAEEGLLMRLPPYQEGKSGLVVSIHMLAVPFPLAVAWLDQKGAVVHAVQARPWRPYYTSPFPAWYLLELHASHASFLTRGARLFWAEEGS